VDDLTLMIDVARDHGLRTFAHCSGIEGIRNAVEAGIGSIEHGFFMDQPMLERMAEKDIAWVQTFSPVHFQWTHPEFAKWSPQTITNIRGIVDSHLEHAALAARLGTPLVAGSDAGSHGVVHGQGLIEELLFLIEAGIPMTEVLTSATSRPRRLWGAPSNRIAADANAEFITYSTSPFENSEALRNVESVVRDGRVLHESKNIELDKITA
jgi:imidazolonepropionase-like amidohydrolase